MEKITASAILQTMPSLNKKDIEAAMNEFAGVKIIEALVIIVSDLPKPQQEEMLIKVDQIIASII